MTTDQNAREAAAKAICKSGKFECGEGACSFLCLGVLGTARGKCGRHSAQHGELADSIIDAYLAALPLPDDAARVVEEAENGTGDLKERLLGRPGYLDSPDHLCEEAAMAIADLEETCTRNAAYIRSQAAALAQMTRERDRLQNTYNLHRGDVLSLSGDLDREHDRAEEAEIALATVTAERDRLREALEREREQSRMKY